MMSKRELRVWLFRVMDFNDHLLTKIKSEHHVEPLMGVVTTEMSASAALYPQPLMPATMGFREV
jgi:hypothetical protein